MSIIGTDGAASPLVALVMFTSWVCELRVLAESRTVDKSKSVAVVLKLNVFVILRS